MSLKILGGKAKGLSLAAPLSGIDLRPTSVLLKRKIFDRFQSLDGFQFVDLCAGTGAMGLEAWSRGATGITFVESSAAHIKLIEKNLESITKIARLQWEEKRLMIVKAKLENWLSQWLGHLDPTATKKMILFFDPPYENHQLYQFFVTTILQSSFEGMVWVESDEKKGPDIRGLQGYGLKVTKVYKQGSRFIVV